MLHILWDMNTYMWYSIFPKSTLMRYRRQQTQSFSDLIVLSIGSIFVLAARYLTWIFRSDWKKKKPIVTQYFRSQRSVIGESLRLIFIDYQNSHFFYFFLFCKFLSIYWKKVYSMPCAINLVNSFARKRAYAKLIRQTLLHKVNDTHLEKERKNSQYTM